MNKTMLIRGGHVTDPDTGWEGTADILVRDGRIARVAPSIDETAEEVFEAEGLTVLPGLVDLHVHLRDPGQTHKEDLTSGSRAAARGGVTSLLAMPNTVPVIDSPEQIREMAARSEALGLVRVFQASAITKGQRGEELVPVEALVQSGALAFSEDGRSVMNPALMREAMLRIGAAGALICDHCEEPSLVAGGVMHADEHARRLGLPGIVSSAEDVIAARDAVLAAETGAKLHLCHCSTAGSADIVRAAKASGARVSAEVCPHHFALTTEDITSDDGNFKMNPPLRSRRDAEALKEALADGTIEVISTDHAPHTAEEKRGGFKASPFGIVGLETSAAVTYTELVRTGVLTLMQMAEKMCLNPARILGIRGGSLREGMPADIAVFDFGHSYVIDPGEFCSRGRNTPFAGREVYGRTKLVLCGGKTVWRE